MYTHLQRYIRVAGTYGSVIRQTNGIGQGCSLSILIANLYVATLFNFLKDNNDELEFGAFLDDRNVTTKSIPSLMEALGQISEFDAIAGHKTNITKSTVFANSQNLRKNLAQVRSSGTKGACYD